MVIIENQSFLKGRTELMSVYTQVLNHTSIVQISKQLLPFLLLNELLEL
uniref:Uncharacterized protein n=1 Tax=Arundo donax TaxID=35708 RepID=A0A0A8YN21_ARUDO